jgi:hypothetical protein
MKQKMSLGWKTIVSAISGHTYPEITTTTFSINFRTRMSGNKEKRFPDTDVRKSTKDFRTSMSGKFERSTNIEHEQDGKYSPEREL